MRSDLNAKILPRHRLTDGLVWSRNLLTYTSPVRLEERRLGWLYLESDITDLQDRLRRFESRDVLELRVAARTSELELEVKERTRAEHELRQRTIFLNTLITNNPLAIAVGGPGGKLELVNPAFEKLFGYSSDEAIGRSVDDLLYPPNLSREEMDSRLKNAKKESIHETEKRRKKMET